MNVKKVERRRLEDGGGGGVGAEAAHDSQKAQNSGIISLEAYCESRHASYVDGRSQRESALTTNTTLLYSVFRNEEKTRKLKTKHLITLIHT